MLVNELIDFVAKTSGMPGERISLELGRSRSFVSVVRSSARTPRVDTVADIADVCGYDLQLVRRDTGATVTVTPPRRASMDRDAGGAVDDLDDAGNGGGA